MAAIRTLTTPVDLAVLELRVGYNPGVAFSLGDSLPPVVVLAVTAVITIAMATFALRAAPRMNLWSRSGFVLVLAGAVGNLAGGAAPCEARGMISMRSVDDVAQFAPACRAR